QSDPIRGRLGIGELAKLVEPLMQLTQARLHELLALKRGLVFRIFPEVAQLDRMADGLGENDVQLMGQLVDFSTQLLLHITDHGCGQTKKDSARRSRSPGWDSNGRDKDTIRIGKGNRCLG